MQIKRDKQQAAARLQDMDKDIKPLEKAVSELNERMKKLRNELRNKVNASYINIPWVQRLQFADLGTCWCHDQVH